jgi:hypothetical protein
MILDHDPSNKVIICRYYQSMQTTTNLFISIVEPSLFDSIDVSSLFMCQQTTFETKRLC